MSSDRKAEMGVGTLIIFIAMILVAAVAASVILQTGTTLEQKALATGMSSIGEISTHAKIIEVAGVDGEDGDLENYTAEVKLTGGSNPIDFESVLLRLNTKNDTLRLVYSGNETYNSTSAGTGTFGVSYLLNGSNTKQGLLQRGDIVQVHFNGYHKAGPGIDMTLQLVPQVGEPTTVRMRVPNVISTKRVTIYPVHSY